MTVGPSEFKKLLWLAGVAGWLIGGAVGGQLIASYKYPAYGDMDTLSFAAFFDGFLTAPVGAAVFVFTALFSRASMERLAGERARPVQWIKAVGIWVVVVTLLFIIGDIPTRFSSTTAEAASPPAAAPGAPVTSPSPALMVDAYPGMHLETSNTSGIAGYTRDSYASVTAYYARQIGGMPIDCSNKCPCQQWTSNADPSVTVQVNDVSGQGDADAQDSDSQTPAKQMTVIELFSHGQ